MPTKIRLQRHGKKGSPYFHIVVADSRAKRDGKFIERIGSYDPNTDPATIELDSDKALDWLSKGAQPSDTARAILSYRGILYKKHLLRGVSKGALSMEDAEAKYQAWLSEKDQKIAGKAEKIKSEAADKASKKLADEMAISEARAKKIIARQSSLAGEAAAAAEADANVAADGSEAGAAEGAEAGLADTSAEAPAATESAPEAKAPDAATTEEAKSETTTAEAPTAENSGTEAKGGESPADPPDTTPADVPADDPKAAEKAESGEEEAAKDNGSESSDKESKKA